MIDATWLYVLEQWIDDPTYAECVGCEEWTMSLARDRCDNCGALACRDPFSGEVEGYMVPTTLVPAARIVSADETTEVVE